MLERIGMGMVGGGVESFIGEVHRMAARLDDRISFVCGALSSTAERSRTSGEILGLDRERTYENFGAMVSSEAENTFQPPMDFVSIVTPNNLHFEPAKEALQSGFHVMLDKPLTHSLEEAIQLRDLAKSTGKLVGVTYTYTGYPMVKEARHIISSGKIGKISKVVVDYPQGWLTRNIESESQKQASWRVDPAQSGKGGALGDIGTHAENIIHYVTGLEIDELSANLTSRYESRILDDDGTVYLRFKNGATGSIRVSQVMAGEENALKISAYGDLGSIHWSHSTPNTLAIKWLDKPVEVLTAGLDKEYLSEYAKKNMRLPSGHPEGFIEAFANIYRNFALTVIAQKKGEPISDHYDYPDVEAGVRGMAFIETAFLSSQENGKWKKFEYAL